MSTEMEAVTGVVRGVMAGLLILTFLMLGLWVFAAKRRAFFDSASRLPLEEDVNGELRS